MPWVKECPSLTAFHAAGKVDLKRHPELQRRLSSRADPVARVAEKIPSLKGIVRPIRRDFPGKFPSKASGGCFWENPPTGGVLGSMLQDIMTVYHQFYLSSFIIYHPKSVFSQFSLKVKEQESLSKLHSQERSRFRMCPFWLLMLSHRHSAGDDQHKQR